MFVYFFFAQDVNKISVQAAKHDVNDLIATIAANQTVYNDSQEIGFGIESCYMIVAYFANGSESIASDEVCNSIDLLTITKIFLLNIFLLL